MSVCVIVCVWDLVEHGAVAAAALEDVDDARVVLAQTQLRRDALCVCV